MVLFFPDCYTYHRNHYEARNLPSKECLRYNPRLSCGRNGQESMPVDWDHYPPRTEHQHY